MSVTYRPATLTCDGDQCLAAAEVNPGDNMHGFELPEGWSVVRATTSVKVVPKGLQAEAEAIVAQAPPGINAGLLRDFYESSLQRHKIPFNFEAYLCPECTQRPLSAHIDLAQARAKAFSDRNLGASLPWSGFGVVEGGRPPDVG